MHRVLLPGLRRPTLAMAGALSALRRLARDSGAVLLHANGSRAMLYAGLVGRAAGLPVIWHVRVLDPDLPLDWILARLATRIIAISAAVRGRFARTRWADEKCVVVPNGLDVAGFVPGKPAKTVRAELGIPEGALVVGSVGRLVPFKGYRYLLDACARMRRQAPNVVGLVVGDGPERLDLERQARALGIERHVRFTGHREDIADLLQIMDVFVLPSVAEHFGRVLLEAMALAKPVVATAAGGVPEIVVDGRTGVLVPAAEAAPLADAVLELLADPERLERLGLAGRDRLLEHFTAAQHAAGIEQVYRDVIDHGWRSDQSRAAEPRT